jgi:adenosylmethionine-8-amino-7-oxononanoate aminotransferase
VREVPTKYRANQSELVVRNSGHGRTLAAVSVEGLNAMFDLGANATQALTERLPIS